MHIKSVLNTYFMHIEKYFDTYFMYIKMFLRLVNTTQKCIQLFWKAVTKGYSVLLFPTN